jgi:hypothetical protein
MKSMLSILIPSVLLTAACDNREPYYDKEGVVSILGLSIESEMGNIGGQQIEISGSGFGEDPNGITVMFGNQNADVVSMTDSAVTVQVPHGPVGGGAVDIRIGNSAGRDTLNLGYTYKLPGNGIEPVFGDVASENQIAYVAVANDMMSCYGGTATGSEYGCQSFALTGQAGIEGRAEGLEIVYPGAESPYGTGKSGFSNDTSISWNTWNISTNTHDIVSFDDENAVQDFRLDIGEFSITNEANSGDWCGNLPSLATFTYNGEDGFVPSETNPVTGELVNPDLTEAGYQFETSSVSPNGDLTTDFGDSNGCFEGGKEYELDTLQFCMTDEYQEGITRSFAAEWPIAQNFFMAESETGQMSADVPVPVRLTIEAANIDEEITLPPVAKFTDTVVGGEEFWTLSDFTDECPDTDEDQVTTSGDSVFNWTWEPLEWETDCDSNDSNTCVPVPESVKGVNSYVTVTINYLSFSWMGGEGVTQQASITVADNNNFDEETGLSSLSLPTWVMYSFPTAQNDYGEQQGTIAGQTSWAGYGDQSDPTNGLLIIALDRKVEYTIEASIDTNVGGQIEKVDGDLIFAYSTGDVGYFGFENPLDSIDPCDDCIDNDGDGWTDDADPDCGTDLADEVNMVTDSTCNDGIDNDGDQMIDSEDENCIDGSAGESEDCSDSIDNDEDGWTDQEDPDCQGGGVFENNPTSEFTCNDGLDNDGDGWVDGEDLACPTSTDSEDDTYADLDEDGLPDFTCNDGIDNDGNGDVDNEDIYCFRRGPDNDESPEFRGVCADGEDNDGDGWIDENDPACEVTNGNSENPLTYDNTDPAFSVLGDCNDGIDNDCDGSIDSEDPGCINAYVGNEADDGSIGTCNCGDDVDNDLDGWVDLDDPDCGGSEFGAEIGMDLEVECNDGEDNDLDGLTDSLDVYCWERVGAEGTAETPANPGAGCSNGTDDDLDGWIDMEDPGCEATNGNSEVGSIDVDHWGAPTCFNGVDDNGDGSVDVDDANCTNWFDNE